MITRRCIDQIHSASYLILKGALALVLIFTMSANAVLLNSTWNGGAGNWSDPANWDTVDEPDNGVDTYNVFIDGGNGVASDVSANLNFTINDLTIDANDQLSIVNSRTLTIEGGNTISNSGLLTIDGSASSTTLAVNAGNVDLTGTGVIQMNGPAVINGSGLGAVLTIDGGQTVQGQGNIGTDNLEIVVQGGSLIDANVSNRTLRINAEDANGLTNNGGELRASNNGTLQIQETIVDNTGGQVTADGGTVDVDGNSSISGGAVDAINGGVLELSSNGRLEGKANTVVTIGNGSSLEITTAGTNVLDAAVIFEAGSTGQLNNAASVTVRDDIVFQTGSIFSLLGTSFATSMLIDGAAVFAGGGLIDMSSGAVNRIEGDNTNDVLTLDNVAIEGRGLIGVDDLELILQNNGRIEANVNNGNLRINAEDVNGLTNNGGELRASNNGTLQIQDTIVNNTGGQVTADGGTVDVDGNSSISGGTIDAINGGVLELSSNGRLEGKANTVVTVGNGSSLEVTTAGTNVLDAAVTFEAGSTGQLNNAASVTVRDDIVFQTGSIFSLLGTSFATSMLIDGAAVFAGGGLIDMSSGATNRIEGANANDVLTLDNVAIEGRGLIGVNDLEIINQNGSRIEANVNNADLRIDANANGVTNSSILKASNNGTLEIRNSTVNNTGGQILADGGTIDINNSPITNGNVDAINGGTIEIRTNGQILGGNLTTIDIESGSQLRAASAGNNVIRATLNNNNGGEVFIQNAADLIIESSTGIITNSGTIQFDPVISSTTELIVSGGEVDIGGQGTIDLGANNTASVISSASGGSLKTDNTIVGAGSISAKTTLDPLGIVDATLSAGIRFSGASDHVNNGLIRVSSGSRIDVDDPISGTGAWEINDGLLDATQAITTTGNISVTGAGELQFTQGITGNDLTLGPNSILDVNGGDVTLTGDLSFAMTDEADWDWAAGSALEMLGSDLEIGGEDFGIDPDNHVGDPIGFVDNFDLNELIIGPGGSLRLVDNIDNGNRIDNGFGSEEALYVDTLTFADATGTIDLNGLHLYFNTINGDLSQIIDTASAVNSPKPLTLFLLLLFIVVPVLKVNHLQ